MNPRIETIFPIFFGVWLVLGISSAAFFYFNRNATLKRKVFPPFVIFVGVLFLTFAGLMGPAREPFFLVVIIPFVALITFVNIRNTRFCDACGKTLVSQNPFTRPKFCSSCGADLDATIH
ncbi:MAG: hypothetical protein AB7G28_16450 [Pirellulales bacterium]